MATVVHRSYGRTPAQQLGDGSTPCRKIRTYVPAQQLGAHKVTQRVLTHARTCGGYAQLPCHFPSSALPYHAYATMMLKVMRASLLIKATGLKLSGPDKQRRGEGIFKPAESVAEEAFFRCGMRSVADTGETGEIKSA
eukprot:4759445-Pyramimonas_sp.AAC.1